MRFLTVCCVLLFGFGSVVFAQSSVRLSDSDVLSFTGAAIDPGDPTLGPPTPSNNQTAVVFNGENYYSPVSVDIYTNSGANNWMFQETLGTTSCPLSVTVDIVANTLAIGEPCEPFAFFGHVDLYRRESSGQWVFAQTLEQPTPQKAYHNFGESVSLSGDTLVVGANPGGESDNPGNIYLFKQIGGQWELQTVLETGEGALDGFGEKVALGDSTLLTSIKLENWVDAVDVYSQSNDQNWILQDSLVADDFDIDGDTMVLVNNQSGEGQSDTSTLLFRTKVSENQWMEQSVVRRHVNSYQVKIHNGIAISIDKSYSAIRDKNETVVSHYQLTSSGEWKYGGEIIPQDNESVTDVDVNSNTVVVATVNYDNGDDLDRRTYVITIPVGDTSECIDTIPTNDGWGWNGSTPCRIAEAEIEQASECIDSDGDGWGWNDSGSCAFAILPISQGITQTLPVCQAANSDSDGDGFGWENNASCIVSTSPSNNNVGSALGQCEDRGGFPWGWNPVTLESCRLDREPIDDTSTGACIDTDPVGDGWGWNGVTSCQLAD